MIQIEQQMKNSSQTHLKPSTVPMIRQVLSYHLTNIMGENFPLLDKSKMKDLQQSTLTRSVCYDVSNSQFNSNMINQVLINQTKGKTMVDQQKILVNQSKTLVDRQKTLIMDLDSRKFDHDDKQNIHQVMTSMHSILGKIQNQQVKPTIIKPKCLVNHQSDINQVMVKSLNKLVELQLRQKNLKQKLQQEKILKENAQQKNLKMQQNMQLLDKNHKQQLYQLKSKIAFLEAKLLQKSELKSTQCQIEVPNDLMVSSAKSQLSPFTKTIQSFEILSQNNSRIVNSTLSRLRNMPYLDRKDA